MIFDVFSQAQLGSSGGWLPAQPLAGFVPLAVSVESTLFVAGFAAGLGLVAVLFLAVAKSFLYICRPNEVLIFTGRRRMRGGVDLGPLIVSPHGSGLPGEGGGQGRAWRIPILERVDRMDMTIMSIDVTVRNAYSAGNIPLQIHAIANVKPHANPMLLRNAIERFLGRERVEMYQVAQQTLEGALREVLAQMTPEQINEDRLTFAENLIRSAKDDLDKLGLELDTLKIQNVSDETGYLDSLGRPRIAAALRDAENAENQAMQEIAEAQAEAHQRAQVAKAEAEGLILSRRNELSRLQSELEGEASAIEREAEAAARTARATAEKELQQLRTQLAERKLHVEMVLPAEAEKEAARLRAKGDAAPTVENGRAIAEVLEVTVSAWRSMGPGARELYVIQHLDEIIATVVEATRSLEVGEVHVVDRGDGAGLASYAATYPKVVASVLSAMRETLGVDVPSLVSGTKELRS